MSRASRPLVGVPWCNAEEEAAGNRRRLDEYLKAVEAAGGHPEPISLQTKDGFSREKIEAYAQMLDAVLLPGSPRDIEPMWYNAERHPRTHPSDPQREQTDFALLDIAFSMRKPVLAICYGVQSLNVFLGGNLVQDISEEVPDALDHVQHGKEQRFHAVHIEDRSILARLAGSFSATVNTSHHQAVGRPARGLRATASAPDRVIEAVELADAAPGSGPPHWVLGVQWHPERLTDPLSLAIFKEFVAAARRNLM
jgi:putative glutamine amidotransferase